jgi:hypothetical protein
MVRQDTGRDPQDAAVKGGTMKALEDMTEPELRQVMTRVARAVAGILPAGTGFLVVASEFGRPGVAQYVGNGQRSDFIRWMRETADRLEAREDVPR